MTTEKVKRTYKRRLTHGMAYKLAEWLKANPEILRTTTKKDLAKKAGEDLGFQVDDWSLSVFATEIGIEIGLPRAPRGSKKKPSENLIVEDENLIVQEKLLKELIKQILISRKWIEVLLRKTFKSPAESTMAFQELYGSSGSMSSTSALEQMPLK